MMWLDLISVCLVASACVCVCGGGGGVRGGEEGGRERTDMSIARKSVLEFNSSAIMSRTWEYCSNKTYTYRIRERERERDRVLVQHTDLWIGCVGQSHKHSVETFSFIFYHSSSSLSVLVFLQHHTSVTMCDHVIMWPCVIMCDRHVWSLVHNYYETCVTLKLCSTWAFLDATNAT